MLLKNKAVYHVIENKNTTLTFIESETVLEQQNWTVILTDSTTEKISKLCAYCFLLQASLFRNIILITIAYRHQDLRKTINYFIVNMAVSDLPLSRGLLPDLVTD